jgi:hypothetical protein
MSSNAHIEQEYAEIERIKADNAEIVYRYDELAAAAQAKARNWYGEEMLADGEDIDPTDSQIVKRITEGDCYFDVTGGNIYPPDMYWANEEES